MNAEVRILLNIIHIFLGFLLLSNINFENTFTTVGSKQNVIAGLGPFNASIDNGDPSFLIYSDLNSLLQSEQETFPVLSPNGTSCIECFSYILPGTLNGIGLVPTGVPPAADPPEGATLYISKAAPAYQLDYYPLHGTNFPSTACQVYGDLMKICLMNVDGDLIAGMLTEILI